MQISSRESEVLNPSEFYEESQIYSEILESPSKENHFNKNKSSSKENNVIKCKAATRGDPPVIKINDTKTTSIDLPSISWHGYNTSPKFMYFTNTGRTILISGQWSGNRPYIEGGPLNGTYQFSQVHFHSPSEHEINGKRYPLEMHVVHYKSCYLTQERAMHEKDGTVVLVYLFEVMEEGETPISSVTKLAPKIEKVNSQVETKNITLDQFVKPFSSKYYVYWGSVSTEKNSYLLQWIIHCDNLLVTRKEMDDLLSIINFRETDANHIPRMKPENDTIYYVEENKEPEKHECSENSKDSKVYTHAHCSTCHLIYEWWTHYCEHNSAKEIEMDKQNGIVLSENAEMHNGNNLPETTRTRIETEKLPDISDQKKKEDCVNEVNHVCDSGRSASSLCVCVHERKKKQTQKVESCTSVAGSQSSVSGKEEKCVKNKKLRVPKQAKSSCPSFASENIEDSCTAQEKVCKPKATSSCPLARITSNISKCEQGNKKKIIWKKSCENDLQVTVSCLSNSLKKEKKKNEKERKKAKEKKKESKCSEPKSSNSKSTVQKKWKKFNKKSKTNTKAEESENKKKEKKNKKGGEEDKEQTESCDLKIPKVVQCNNMTQSTPSMSFNRILREFDNLIESKNKSRLFNISSKLHMTSKTPENKTQKEAFTSGNKDDIKTLFEKKRETSKPSAPTTVQSSINYLLTSTDDQYSRSSGVTSSSIEGSVGKKTSDLSLLFKPENLSWSGVDVSAVNSPAEKTKKLKNELCVQMELLFHSDNKVFSGSSAQEYDLALLYNQKILQEYKGVLHPDRLEIGQYEKLDLFPKYPELGGLSVQLKDCTVKLESVDQLCMRAKFLLKEPDFDGVTSEIRENMSENPPKALLTLNDAVTQCSLKECVDKEVDCLISKEQHVSRADKRCSERYPKRIAFFDSHLDESEKEKPVDEIILKAGTSECKIRLDPNPDIDLEQSSKNRDEPTEPSIESEKGKDINVKEINTKSAKELKNLLSNQKKTIYFVYEKIEKDENSGKKIFVGSFRTKEEAEALSKERPLEQDIKPGETFDNNDKRNLLLFPNKKTDSDKVLPVERVSEMKKESVASNTCSQNKKKDFPTLHKHATKVCTLKKEHINVAVGRVVNELNQNSQNFKRLIDLVGIDKGKKPKVFIYELQETAGVSSSTTGKKNKNLSTVQDYIAQSGMSLQKKRKVKSPRCESPASSNQKTLSEKVSQSALIITPVEVESLSKVEVMLIQHSSSVKSCKNSEKEIIPCLNYYK